MNQWPDWTVWALKETDTIMIKETEVATCDTSHKLRADWSMKTNEAGKDQCRRKKKIRKRIGRVKWAGLYQETPSLTRLSSLSCELQEHPDISVSEVRWEDFMLLFWDQTNNKTTERMMSSLSEGTKHVSQKKFSDLRLLCNMWRLKI